MNVSHCLRLALASMATVLIGACSLVVDFDRSLLLDAGVDAAVDASVDASVDAAVDAAVDASADADVPADAGPDAN